MRPRHNSRAPTPGLAPAERKRKRRDNSRCRAGWSGYWIIGNRRALSSLPPDLLELVNASFDAAASKERADLAELDRSLQAELTGRGMAFNKPDPVHFREALVKAGFYTQWRKTYGEEAWAQLEKYTGELT